MDRNFNGSTIFGKDPSEETIETMKFSALSVAAIFTLFARTIAEPLPQTGTAVEACPTQTFPCVYSLLCFSNPSVNYLFIIERWWAMCKLINLEVAVNPYHTNRIVLFLISRNYNVGVTRNHPCSHISCRLTRVFFPRPSWVEVL